MNDFDCIAVVVAVLFGEGIALMCFGVLGLIVAPIVIIGFLWLWTWLDKLDEILD